jgi:exodeoxyribonuclease-1
MTKSYFFYDLETTGLNPREDRIMQFAGIRTDEQFNQIGEPYNLLIALNDDTLPSPDALMVTGITPQQTVDDGYTEAQFAALFVNEICTPNTVIVGFNNIRFDDEFIRALLWRNFHDPYAWAYEDGRSRWDMLDVVRLTRALRPEGIKWPTVDGVAVNKLELLSKENGLVHTKAHDALSDVEALIAITKLITEKQPQLFSYLFKMRDKKEVKKLLQQDAPFVYASGRYDSEFHKTTVAMTLAEADYGNVFVYDLRHDPAQWVNKTKDELAQVISTPYAERPEKFIPLPVKKLQLNRSPAVAPLGVLNQAGGWRRLGLTLAQVEERRKILRAHPAFSKSVQRLLLDRPAFAPHPEAEGRLYDGFIENVDKMRVETIRNASRLDMKTMAVPKFEDGRLRDLYPRYKARNYPQFITAEERQAYEEYRSSRLGRQAPLFTDRLQKLASSNTLTDHQQYVLEELKLWFESIMPVAD